jgi:hypothetical protein
MVFLARPVVRLKLRMSQTIDKHGVLSRDLLIDKN